MRMKRNFVWKSWCHSSIAIARPVELGRRRFRQSVGGVQCAVCGLRARRFRHRTIFPPVFIRWAGPWCMRLGVDGKPRSCWKILDAMAWKASRVNVESIAKFETTQRELTGSLFLRNSMIGFGAVAWPAKHLAVGCNGFTTLGPGNNVVRRHGIEIK